MPGGRNLKQIWNRPRWAPRWQPRRPDWHPAVLMSISYTTIGLGLIFQPDRFDSTPAYANLLDVMGQIPWGVLYLVTAGLLALSLFPFPRRQKWATAVLAHTVAIALTGVWLAAFIVRYATNDGTTVINIVSWGVFLALLIRSALTLTDRMDTT